MAGGAPLGNHNHRKHGLSNTRIYKIWKSMKQRCQCKTSHCYFKYGEKGVKVCKEWEEFPLFFQWAMDNGYRDDLSIDRIDPFGNYEPDNCRWVDFMTQQNNKRNTVYLTVGEETKSLHDWSVSTGIPHKILWQRMRRKVPEEKMLTPLK